MHYIFDMNIATKYGLEEAVFLQNIAFWTLTNKSNEVNFYDGRYWTFNSQDAFIKLFPFWTRQSLRRIINSCKDKGLILTGNYNKSSYDRTLWYALSDKGLSITLVENNQCINKTIGDPQPIDRLISTNEMVGTNQPIPYINTDNKQKIKAKRYCPSDDGRPGFEKFWSLYPRKEKKKDALRSWIKNDLEKNSDAIESHLMKRLEGEWDSKDMKYIPMPTTFLNGERWLDDLTVIKSKPKAVEANTMTMAFNHIFGRSA